MSSLLGQVSKLFRPYYFVNILMSFSFIFLRTTSPFCYFVFPGQACELQWRETEILFFMAVVIVFKNRRLGNMSLVQYLNASFIWCKVANATLFFFADPRAALFYITLWILSVVEGTQDVSLPNGYLLVLLVLILTRCEAGRVRLAAARCRCQIYFQLIQLSLEFMMIPEPAYGGPESVMYFQGPNLEEEINNQHGVTWLITFYAAWSPPCVSFAPVFAKLSNAYGLENLKFGKLDVTRFNDVAKKYNVSDSSFMRQLPTVILFQNGKEMTRRPAYDKKGKLSRFFFTEDNVIAAFDLNNLYDECKRNPLKKKKQKKEE